MDYLFLIRTVYAFSRSPPPPPRGGGALRMYCILRMYRSHRVSRAGAIVGGALIAGAEQLSPEQISPELLSRSNYRGAIVAGAIIAGAYVGHSPRQLLIITAIVGTNYNEVLGEQTS